MTRVHQGRTVTVVQKRLLCCAVPVPITTISSLRLTSLVISIAKRPDLSSTSHFFLPTQRITNADCQRS